MAFEHQSFLCVFLIQQNTSQRWCHTPCLRNPAPVSTMVSNVVYPCLSPYNPISSVEIPRNPHGFWGKRYLRCWSCSKPCSSRSQRLGPPCGGACSKSSRTKTKSGSSCSPVWCQWPQWCCQVFRPILTYDLTDVVRLCQVDVDVWCLMLELRNAGDKLKL